MPIPLEFLIVDHHRDNRFLLTKTLLRKYPDAKIHEHEESQGALSVVMEGRLAAAVIHRADDMDGIFLIRRIREANAKLPILSISGFDRREQTLAAGASAFLHYDAWLSIGRVVEEMMRFGQTENPFQALAFNETDRARESA
jgi:CheY-like chemotaxis protein